MKMVEFKQTEIEETNTAIVQAIITEQDNGEEERNCNVRIEGSHRNIEIGIRAIIRGFVRYLQDEDIRKDEAFEVIANYCIDAINNTYGDEETENGELCVAYNDFVDANKMEEA